MKVFRIAAVLASGILLALAVLLSRVENPELALYEEVMEVLWQEERWNSLQELEDCFPVLIDIQSDLQQIDHWKQMMRSRTGGPMSVETEEEKRQLDHFRKQIQRLQKKVRAELGELLRIHGPKQV
ncbi:MAG: hypothetical protein AAFV95_17990 [Bacteroidota bacterium]